MGEPASHSSSPGPIHILVADDTPANLMAFKEILHRPDWDIITVSSGVEALQETLKWDMAVILLDVRMPHMDGLETAQLIRKRDRLRFTPIIFMSAYDRMPTDVAQGYLAGGIDYLFSPVDGDLLKFKVNACVDLYLRNTALRQEAEDLRRANEQLTLKLLRAHQSGGETSQPTTAPNEARET